MVANMNSDELGHLRLSAREVDDIVAFMLTLTDGWERRAAR
jgi:cytochrome c peroxidase